MDRKDNFIVLYQWIHDDLCLSGTEAQVYAIIYSFCKDRESNSHCISVNYFSKTTGVTEKTIRNVLKRLQEYNYITINKFDGKQSSYSINYDVLDAICTGAKINPGKIFRPNQITEVSGKNYRAQQSISSSSLNNLNNISGEQNNKVVNIDLTQNEFAHVLTGNESAFIQFWEEYPRKKDKDRAWKAFNKIPNVQDLMPKILASVQMHIKYDKQWKDKQYIPYPSTFLNGKRWDDDIDDGRTELDKWADEESDEQVEDYFR